MLNQNALEVLISTPNSSADILKGYRSIAERLLPTNLGGDTKGIKPQTPRSSLGSKNPLERLSSAKELYLWHKTIYL
jgi:hypothetical protein